MANKQNKTQTKQPLSKIKSQANTQAKAKITTSLTTKETIIRSEHCSLGASTILGTMPVVIVTVYDQKQQRYNALTIAWTGIINTKPPMVSISVRPSRHSYQLLLEQQYFAINLVNKELVKAADYLGVKTGAQTDKLARLGLVTQTLNVADLDPTNSVPNKSIAYLVASPLQLICRINSTQHLGSHTLILAEILDVLVEPQLLDEANSLHLEKANLVCYTHGQYYALTEWLGFFGFSLASDKIYNERKKRQQR